MRKSLLMFVWLAVAAVLVPAGPLAQNATPTSSSWKTPWSYEGPRGAEHWGDLDPAYAACNGKEQSPIDIRSAEKADLPALQFQYKPGPIFLINNGYTAVRVDYARGNGNFLLVGSERYELTQFHFHHPSEEALHGKHFAMVLHLMHVSSGGKVLGVAVPLKAGLANSTVAQLWEHMPQSAGPLEEVPGMEVDPANLIPHDTGYYTYMGSQTAPPCTEGVTWIVLKTPMEISEAQISAFAKLYPHDVRPVQPLNGRVVKESR